MWYMSFHMTQERIYVNEFELVPPFWVMIDNKGLEQNHWHVSSPLSY